MKLKNVSVLCNYPDEEHEAALSKEMTIENLTRAIKFLVETETDMTSFVITAVVDRN